MVGQVGTGLSPALQVGKPRNGDKESLPGIERGRQYKKRTFFFEANVVPTHIHAHTHRHTRTHSHAQIHAYTHM